jgi:hypothetical protein
VRGHHAAHLRDALWAISAGATGGCRTTGRAPSARGHISAIARAGGCRAAEVGGSAGAQPWNAPRTDFAAPVRAAAEPRDDG